MNDLLHWKTQLLQLEQLLADAQGDPILEPQLRSRVESVRSSLAEAEAVPGSLLPRAASKLPRMALFLRGNGVDGTTGIRPALAGEALIQYERMFVEQSLHDERLAARQSGRQRRRRGSPRPELMFTGTPRGSFGLELVPRSSDESQPAEAHIQSLNNVAALLDQISRSDVPFDKRIEPVPPRLLTHAKAFFESLAAYDSELRIAFSDRPSLQISGERIRATAERFRNELHQEIIDIRGKFRGLTRESLLFDLVDEQGVLIKGNVSEDLAEEDLERIDALTNKLCTARIERSELQQVSGAPPRVSHVLLNATPVEEMISN